MPGPSPVSLKPRWLFVAQHSDLAWFHLFEREAKRRDAGKKIGQPVGLCPEHDDRERSSADPLLVRDATEGRIG